MAKQVKSAGVEIMDIHSRSRVAVVRCRSYERDEVAAAVNRAVELLGGIGSFVRGGQNVLIKPNMLSPQPPEKAVTTHPSIVWAVARLAASAGCIPSIGDSPGFYRFSKVASVSGIREIADELGVKLLPFEKEETVSTAAGCLMRSLVLAREVVRSDAIISLSKFKTHVQTSITGAIKNVFGCMPGLKKAEMHYRFPDNEKFSSMLVDICLTAPAKLHVMDAVVGMDGNGPGAGDPFRMNLIIAGCDPVAVDSTACRIVGINPFSIPMIRIGEERGLGHADGSLIDILGEKIEDVRVPGFKAIWSDLGPGSLIPLPSSLSRLFQRWVVKRPCILPDICTRCGACAEICPARPKAISPVQGKMAVNKGDCILCYCCSEICPSRAITLRRGFAASLLARLLKL